MSPAKISNITINDDKKTATATVDEDQLSLAIGKAGQNVRLAAKLTGWKIDIISGDEKKPEDTGKEEKDDKKKDKEEEEDDKKDKDEPKEGDAPQSTSTTETQTASNKKAEEPS